jgi:hypothetical protein
MTWRIEQKKMFVVASLILSVLIYLIPVILSRLGVFLDIWLGLWVGPPQILLIIWMIVWVVTPCVCLLLSYKWKLSVRMKLIALIIILCEWFFFIIGNLNAGQTG